MNGTDAAMLFRNTVAERRLQPEMIDEPDLAPERLWPALRGLERINWWSASAGILWPSIRALARQTPGRSLQLLDLGTGAGDVPIRLWHKARRAGLTLEVAACDRNPQTIAFARRRAEERRAPVHFFQWDVVHQGEPPQAADVVTCSLFLHHLNHDDARLFLGRMAQAARRLVLVNDLIRSRLGYLLAYAGTRILSGSPMVHSDGPRSVEGAFTMEEVHRLAEESGLEGATVERRWPCRYLLRWQQA
jgi:2-polyprenyl-3-methyl-5-hydroxy-6-metoxy-1,4-benzoquinol methylase